MKIFMDILLNLFGWNQDCFDVNCNRWNLIVGKRIPDSGEEGP